MAKNCPVVVLRRQARLAPQWARAPQSQLSPRLLLLKVVRGGIGVVGGGRCCKRTLNSPISKYVDHIEIWPQSLVHHMNDGLGTGVSIWPSCCEGQHNYKSASHMSNLSVATCKTKLMERNDAPVGKNTRTTVDAHMQLVFTTVTLHDIHDNTVHNKTPAYRYTKKKKLHQHTQLCLCRKTRTIVYVCMHVCV